MNTIEKTIIVAAAFFAAHFVEIALAMELTPGSSSSSSSSSSLQDRVMEIKQLNTIDLLGMPIDENDVLRRADLGAGFYRAYLPKGAENRLENFKVILGKRFNGKLKWGVGGAVEREDQTLFDAANRENEEEQFGTLSIGAATDTQFLDRDITFKPGSGNPKKEDLLFAAFFTLDNGYTQDELDGAVEQMNQIAPHYFNLSKFFTTLSKTDVATLGSDDIQQEAASYLEKAGELPDEYAFNEEVIAELCKLAQGMCSLQGDEFGKFAVKNIHTHAEYNWFIQVPYLDFKSALQNESSLRCQIPDLGVNEEVKLFGPEKAAALKFMTQFESTREAE